MADEAFEPSPGWAPFRREVSSSSDSRDEEGDEEEEGQWTSASFEKGVEEALPN